MKLSKLIYKKNLNKFLREDGDSSSKLIYWQGNKKNIWVKIGKQARLAKFLKRISDEYNFVVYFATHSIPMIKQILPSNIFHLRRNITSKLEYLNPCHSVYATCIICLSILVAFT